MPGIEQLTIGVHPGAALPEIGEPMYLRSELYDNVFWKVTPVSFQALRWNNEGMLIVDLRATRKQVNKSEVPES